MVHTAHGGRVAPGRNVRGPHPPGATGCAPVAPIATGAPLWWKPGFPPDPDAHTIVGTFVLVLELSDRFDTAPVNADARAGLDRTAAGALKQLGHELVRLLACGLERREAGAELVEGHELARARRFRGDLR